MHSFIERWEQQKREAAEKPSLEVESLSETRGTVTVLVGERRRKLKAHMLLARISNRGTASVTNARVAGALVPVNRGDALHPFAWTRLDLRSPMIEFQIPAGKSTGRLLIEQIGPKIYAAGTHDEIVMIPKASYGALIGLTLEGCDFAYFGTSVIPLPFNGGLKISALTERYGVLTTKWYGLKIAVWNKIAFEGRESPPFGFNLQQSSQ